MQERKLRLQVEIQQVLNFCRKYGVDVVANQKVIDAGIREIFRENGILALERFGTVDIRRLQKVSGAKTLATNMSCLSLSATSIGFLDDLVLLKKSRDKSYLRFSRKNARVKTVLLHHWNTDTCEELTVRSNIISFNFVLQ